MTSTEPARTVDVALQQLRLDGAIFFRAEMSEGWSYESPPSDVAHVLHPGAERLIMFHIVAAGTLWVTVDGGERHWANAGDVIVLPYGDQHSVGGVLPAESVPILTLLEPPPWDGLPVLSSGGGGARTDMVCGYLHSDDPLFNPALHALPPVFVIRPEGAAAQWVSASIEYAIAMSRGGASTTDAISIRLPELLLVEVLRLHLATAPAADRGWIAALHDPLLAPVLAQLHADPARHWTVAELAAKVSVSRSLLDERFRQVLGQSPIRYLTDWRMHVAEELLVSTDNRVGAIAHEVGYDAEEAFSRAFKRTHGDAPSAWRLARRGPAARRAALDG